MAYTGELITRWRSQQKHQDNYYTLDLQSFSDWPVVGQQLNALICLLLADYLLVITC